MSVIRFSSVLLLISVMLLIGCQKPAEMTTTLNVSEMT